jgi:Family of unknown function (DUF6069)
MTATITTATTTAPTTRSARRTLWLAGLASGAVAAVATTAVAAFADAIDQPLTVDGEMIPVVGFAQMTLIGAVIGVVLALVLRRRATRPQRTFTVATWVLTAVSCIPSVVMGTSDGVGNAATLVATHVIAAAIVIPALATRIPAHR